MPGEKESWRTTVIVLMAISLVIGLIQRTGYIFLDPKFEVCIIYVPTILSLIIYYKLPESSNSQV